MAWTCATSMQAQQVTVSPLPQEITWGSKAFDKGFSYTLTGESDADADAVRVLKSELTAQTLLQRLNNLVDCLPQPIEAASRL